MDYPSANEPAPAPQLSAQDGLRFVHVPAGELASHWPWVLRGLAVVKRRVHGRISYTPMHVRQSLLQSQAYLYVVTDDGVPAAFTVVTIQNDPFLLVPCVLHVWILYTESPHLSVTRFAVQEIIELGKKLCLERVHFLSPRANEQSWRRLAGVPGQLTMAAYEFNLFKEIF
jgi:hypothetical protein